MSILGRIGNRIRGDIGRLPGGNTMMRPVDSLVNKSPVLNRLPGIQSQAPIGPSPNALQNMAGPLAAGAGGVINNGSMQGPPSAPGVEGVGDSSGGQVTFNPDMAPSTGITSGIVGKPVSGVGPQGPALQDMMNKRRMMNQRGMMDRQAAGPQY